MLYVLCTLPLPCIVPPVARLTAFLSKHVVQFSLENVLNPILMNCACVCVFVTTASACSVIDSVHIAFYLGERVVITLLLLPYMVLLHKAMLPKHVLIINLTSLSLLDL